MEDNKLIIMMLVYSAMKIRANLPELYSVLNPDTSSDSPSAKSNGVRFVSAKAVENHVRNDGRVRIIIHENCSRLMIDKLNEEIKIRDPNRIRAILTSYEIVWATLRRAPKREYFEFEDQPAARVV